MSAGKTGRTRIGTEICNKTIRRRLISTIHIHISQEEVQLVIKDTSKDQVKEVTIIIILNRTKTISSSSTNIGNKIR